MKHIVVFAQAGRFAAWPANNGLWSWNGQEILAGCVQGGYDPAAEFHSIQEPYRHFLLRSRDGGESWQAEAPQRFVGERQPVELSDPLDFTHPGLALRVIGTGYHGSQEARGAVLASYDRGQTWQGPFRLGGLDRAAELTGLLLTPRTDYLVEGERECLLMLSARPGSAYQDGTFCARTADGGLSFSFVGWVSAGGPQPRGNARPTVCCAPGVLVSALRRRVPSGDENWIDAYGSRDGGRSWSFLARVGETGAFNGNPPALARLADGRLACVYGRRDRRQMVARLSRDEGRSWEEERILRDDFYDRRPDLGYPRLVQRGDGQLLALYYWATRDLPHQHIAATLWSPDE